VELYLDETGAAADLRAAVADVPDWVDELEVIARRWLDEPQDVCLN
jgi:hypothetical protein